MHDPLRLLPMSDGGDGFGEVLGTILGGRARAVKTVDAAGRACSAKWLESPHGAIVESARVIGLALLPPGKYHPFELDTYGLGKLLKAAVRHSAGRLLIGIGGSATNDGGFGMARALGWRFFNSQGKVIERWTDLYQLAKIVPPENNEGFRNVTVAVDVTNPLLGTRGATRVYGPQKGLRAGDFIRAESCLKRMAEVLAKHLGCDHSREAGTGAAGGLGFGLRTFLGADLQPGFEVFATHAGLDKELKWADVVVTGEGRIDRSTLMGKGVGELARRCQARGLPCLAAGGTVELPRRSKSFAGLVGLTQLASEEQALARPAFWLEEAAARLATQSCP
jgi:glycerate kinase